MKKKILSTLLAGAAIATMGLTSASANTLDALSGPVTFQFSGGDAAQAYDTSGIGNGDTLCATVALCNGVSLFGDDAPGANQSNDTWGLVDVHSILGGGGWNQGDDGDYLLAYFYGFQDAQVDRVSAYSTDFFSVGGSADVYRVDAADYAAILANQTDQNDIESILSSLTLSTYLELEFMPGGCSLSNPFATLCSNFNTDVLPNGAGFSRGIATVQGGDAASKYPGNFNFEQTTSNCATTLADPFVCNSYNIRVNSGSATTTALPEPGALGLLGLGLVGMGLIARRRKA
ncbi:hypothetical protein MNBD_ALPHA03-1497 [hydrothermal vent metagenome]|uniref:Ice-binding protein C-terminal domain-containing protein n=1 Tax=hydrothermal vent metagenome TaxID=652676 RepID=A0A3B1AWT3_9ZZZZ